MKRRCHESIQRLHHTQRQTIDLTDPHILHEELMIALQVDDSSDNDAEELAAYLLDEKISRITGYPPNYRHPDTAKPPRRFLGLKMAFHFHRHHF